MPLRAVTFDYWDTLYDGHAIPERVRFRKDPLLAMLVARGKLCTRQPVALRVIG